MMAERETQNRTFHASSPEPYCWSLASNKINTKKALSPVLLFFFFSPYPRVCAETTLACRPPALLAFGVFKVRHRVGSFKVVQGACCPLPGFPALPLPFLGKALGSGTCGEGEGLCSCCIPTKGKEAALLLF